MKKITLHILLYLITTTNILYAQNSKSLLWEISGNGLTKNSYLYGTMHLSDKVSYHLSDRFFTHLLAADMVGNESDPETWSSAFDLLVNNSFSTNKFYSEFYLFPIKKLEVTSLFTNNNNYFNSLLSRTSEDKADYQENTYLDMFIYQTGRKHKKKIVGLEDAKGSLISLSQIKTENFVPKEEHKLALYKLLKNRSLTDALAEYYREKDIEILDSLYRMIFPQKAYETLITKRNVIMTRSIDSLARMGSLFSAVGAAHLGGKQGIIKMLQEKGYQVNPIVDAFTEIGKNKKTAIEKFYMAPEYQISGTKDGMIRLPMNKNIIEKDNDLGSPDFTNGGVINIKRMPLNDFLKKNETTFDPKTLDSLFFEKIPGNILEKKYHETDNYSFYDIKNITKTGNAQHYRFYITPLEIIVVSMVGPGNYVRQYEDAVFHEIKIKPTLQTWEQINPAKGGFTVEVPSYNIAYGNTTEKTKDVHIQAYDPNEKSYYFVTEKTLTESTLENSEYEQKQIHYEFYLQHHIDSLSTHYDRKTESFESLSKLGDLEIKLKTYIVGQKYYLLGTVNAVEKNSRRFFDSFKSEAFQYNSATKTYTDSLSGFTVALPEKPNEKLFIKIKPEITKEKNIFVSKSENYTFKSDSGKTIDLLCHKFHKYQSETSIDSIKSGFRDFFLNKYLYDETQLGEFEFYDYAKTSMLNPQLYDKKGLKESLWEEIMKDNGDEYTLTNETYRYDKPKNQHIFEALSSKDNSLQAIKYKAIFKEDAYYIIKTLVEKNYRNDDPFIEKTYRSFEPMDTKTEGSIFDSKVNLFITDARSTSDTIRYSALNSINELKINPSDYETLKDFLNSFEFRDNETTALVNLLTKIGETDHDDSIELLEQFYKKSTVKTAVQLSILTTLSNRKSKAGYKKILELLEYDLPLSDNEYDIVSLFSNFEKDLENSKTLFPGMFQYYEIKEYSKPVLSLYNKILDEGLLSTGRIDYYQKKSILTNAKLEYKRLLSWTEKNNETENKFDYETEAPSDNLIDHINIIYHYQQDKLVRELLQKIKNLDLPEINIEFARLDAINNKLNDEQANELLNDPKTRFVTMQLLANKNDFSFLNLFTDEDIAKAAILNFETVKEKDSLSLLEKRKIENNGKKITYYFYQLIRETKEGESTTKELIPVAFINQENHINPQAYKTFTKEEIIDEEKLPSQFKSIIEQSLNENHFRASFQKVEDSTNSIFSDF